MSTPVLLEISGGIALIALNRPQRHNAINQALLVHLYDIIDDIRQSDDIKVAVLTGKGKSFCSGLDLDALKTENLFDPRGDGSDLPDVIAACGKPIIGAVNGHAITGGFEMALNCDFLIASQGAMFADTHLKVGIHPGWGMSQLLQQAVGRRMAKQLSFTGQTITASQALAMGLVNEVVEPEELIPRTMEIASQIATADRTLLPVMKQLIEYGDHTYPEEAWAHERREFRDFIKSMGQTR